ncbi:LOB domain-containing protein 15 isoform X1 [Momordica charantia]|uniref:LOB domain-containing protein 15 isoform X1 n=1 Tax=Momordica charantia TaxID=3673 RepID=A0A6J1D0I7_MOMCH|nr:LOB domain-containing protein 15 isoform X1 [Momordica charantia]
MSKERERFDEIAKKIKRETDVSSSSNNLPHQIMGRRQTTLQSPPGTLNTITPCAACKLLRRRCVQECPFSPYFSPHEPHKFASVHKVFGASNVSKMLMEVAENQRADAANSLVYEANVRLRDPVYGCMGAISALQHQIQALQVELNAVRAEILRYKYREANIIHSSPQHVPFLSSSAEVVSIAVPPPPPLLPPPPHYDGSASSSSSLYNRPAVAVAADYSTISSDENVPYFVRTSTTHQLDS